MEDRLTIWILPLKPTEWGFVQKRGVSSTWTLHTIIPLYLNTPHLNQAGFADKYWLVITTIALALVALDQCYPNSSWKTLKHFYEYQNLHAPKVLTGQTKWNKIKKQPHSRRGACLPCVLKWDRNLDSSILASQESHVLRFTWEDRLVIYWPCLTTNRIMVC